MSEDRYFDINKDLEKMIKEKEQIIVHKMRYYLKKHSNIVDTVKEIFKKNKNSHDWEHTERVFKLCSYISKKKPIRVNNEVLALASILHDIGRGEQDKNKGKVCHAEIGAKRAKEILLDNKIDEKTIDDVIHCIETHRYRGNKKPKTIEAKILFDADKLDSIGAIGIGRAFLFAGEIGAKVHNKKDIDILETKSYTEEDTAYREYMVKLKFIKKKMMTKTGKKIAKKRDKFMKKFFKQLEREYNVEF